MAHYKALLASLPEYFSGQDLMLQTSLVCALIMTFCWTVLGTKLKLTLCFTIGVLLFKALFDQLIDKRLFPDIHSYLPYMLGGTGATSGRCENRTISPPNAA